MVRIGLIKKLTFQQILGERKAKTPKVGTCLFYFRNIKAAGMARVEMVKDEVREISEHG